jgi:hypothetical protein
MPPKTKLPPPGKGRRATVGADLDGSARQEKHAKPGYAARYCLRSIHDEDGRFQGLEIVNV